MKTCFGPDSATSFVVAAASLLTSGSSPARPRQAQWPRTSRQRQGHFQQPTHLGNAQLGQHRVLQFFSPSACRIEASEACAIIESVM